MSFFREVCERNVIKVMLVYLSTSWLLWQIVDLVRRNLSAPDWIMQVFLLILAVGFIIMPIAAWFLELTPQGIKHKKNIAPGASIARQTGRQLTRGTIMILSMAVVLFLTDKFRDEAWFETKTGTTEPGEGSSNGEDDCEANDLSSTECVDEMREN